MHFNNYTFKCIIMHFTDPKIFLNDYAKKCIIMHFLRSFTFLSGLHNYT